MILTVLFIFSVFYSFSLLQKDLHIYIISTNPSLSPFLPIIKDKKKFPISSKLNDIEPN